MIKIRFRYDKFKCVPFNLRDKIRIPFMIDGMQFHITVDADRAELTIHTENIPNYMPVVKDVQIQPNGITMLLGGKLEGFVTPVFISFEQISSGLTTLGALDPYMLGELTGFQLGELHMAAATWMALKTSIIDTASQVVADALDNGMHLDNQTLVTIGDTEITGDLRSVMGLVGLKSRRDVTLGDMDSCALDAIDEIFTAFRIFGDVPAELAKGIVISGSGGRMTTGSLALGVSRD